MAQLVKYPPCKHKDMSLIPRTYGKKSPRARDRQIPGVFRPGSIAYWDNSRPIRDSVSKQTNK